MGLSDLLSKLVLLIVWQEIYRFPPINGSCFQKKHALVHIEIQIQIGIENAGGKASKKEK